MARRTSKNLQNHAFCNKLLLNQWLISLFGINPFLEERVNGRILRPFHKLAEPLRDPQLEGLDADNIHKFYHNLVSSEFFNNQSLLTKEQILYYEENIVRHTQKINENRKRTVVWKHYQWLSLLFVEIYLDRFFANPEGLLNELNMFVHRFNRHWPDYVDVPVFSPEELNKLCLQKATGSGKTLLMHINLLQYEYVATRHGKDKSLSRTILLTPNERLSEQHISEFKESGIQSGNYLQSRGSLFGLPLGLQQVDVLEITKLADQDGPHTIATRSLGDQNLLLVDEGHRGLSGKKAKEEENAWFRRRAHLCEKGFTFEYSATFEQAVVSAKNNDFENTYAKTVIFDYSYRWFYEDGFGKDYQILNLPQSFEETQAVYMTACLLKFYQQLRIFEEKTNDFEPFNLEKPLWVFVGSTVSSGKLNKDEQIVATDVALIIQFIADFLANPQTATRRMQEVLTGKGQDTGLLDKAGNDIFDGAFSYLAQMMNGGETTHDLYRDILVRLFNNNAGGRLVLDRIKGESGEVALRVGTSEIPFGLINVGNAKSLCEHVAAIAAQSGISLTVEDNDFAEAMFASVKESTSPINVLIGSKKFVEGWDCWRVSTMGLMHVGRSEGSQIIQLFGRGVRLKGYEWSLKRSGHLREQHLSMLDWDRLYFELEQFKRERSWHNFNISKDGINKLVKDPSWYTLYLPQTRLNPASFDGVLLLQQVAAELLKRYCDHYYNFRKREYIEPRLELRELTQDDDNIPKEEFYQLIVDGNEQQVIQGIQQIKNDLKQNKEGLLQIGDLNACNFRKHLFQPLFHIRRGGKITVLPVTLGESEYQFVSDLKAWCDSRKSGLKRNGIELFLLRNMSRGKGVGFFEAGNFHPDFLLWVLAQGKQYVTFIEPHGLLHEGPASEKVLLHKRIKDVEQRLNDPDVILNSFILSWTSYSKLKWDNSRDELEDQHVLFMNDDRDRYIEKLFSRLQGMMKVS